MINTNAQGTLSNGTKWLFDGDEVFTYSPATEAWAVPCWASLTEGERNELAAIGAEMNALKDVAQDYGRGWIDARLADEGVAVWGRLPREAFFQAIANANAPDFTVTGPNGEPLDDEDGTFFLIAAEAAWEALQRALED